MYKIQDLVKTIRHPDRNYGVLSIAQAQERVTQTGRLYQVAIQGDNEQGICITKAAFFTDEYCFGLGVLSNSWVPCSCSLPMYVKPRPELTSGVILTVEDYMAVFNDQETITLQSIEELVDYLNKTSCV